MARKVAGDEGEVGVLLEREVPRRMLWDIAMARIAHGGPNGVVVSLDGALRWAAEQLLALEHDDEDRVVVARRPEQHANRVGFISHTTVITTLDTIEDDPVVVRVERVDGKR